MKAKYFYFFICLMGLNLYAQKTLHEDSNNAQDVIHSEVSDVIPSLALQKNMSSQQSVNSRSSSFQQVEFIYDISSEIPEPDNFGNAGVAFFNNQFWVSRWNFDDIHLFDASGNFIETFQIPGLSKTRSITTDGTYLYMGTAQSFIYKVDPLTKTVVSTIAISTNSNANARICAYDPSLDNNQGGFWIGDFNTDIASVDMDGNELSIIPQSTHGLFAMYGGAVDGSGHLFVYHQDVGAPVANNISVIDLNTGLQVGATFDVNSVTSQINDPSDSFAGGLFISDEIIPNKKIVIGLNQGGPNLIVGLDFGLASNNNLTFQEVVSRNGFALGSVAFGDVDGDSDQDLTVTGSRGIRPNGNAFGPQVSWLFKNDGSGFFDYDINAPFMGMSHASSVFRDFNNDGNLDFMSTGENFSTGVNSVNIYENDGSGNFNLSGLTALDNNLKRRDFVYANLDGDPEEEILVIGITNGGVARTIVYDWQGSFYKRINVPTLPRVRSGSIDVADVDADGDMDVFITGRRANNTLISGLYLNNGNFQFTQDLTSSFTPVSKGDSKFSDVDNDGDMDLIMSGIDSSLNNVMKLYLNDGSGVFTEEMNVFPDFPDVLFDSYNTADIDGDGDMDIILGGYNTVTFKTTARIWENLLLSNPNRTQQKPNTFALNFPENDIVNFGDNFSLYPNPAKNGVFSIKTPNFEGDTTLSISNVMGNEIIRKDVNISRQEVQVEAQSLKRGMYIVKLSQGLNTYTARLMVE